MHGPHEPELAPAVDVDIREGYARWAPSYPPTPHNPFMRLEQRTMDALLRDVRRGECLDLACGSGRYTRLLLHTGATFVVGLDASPDMIAVARREVPNVAFVVGDARHLPFASARFDLVTFALGIGHVRALGELLREIARVLRPDGTVVYSDMHPCGVLSGWTRIVTIDGTRFRLPHHVHLASDHVRACRDAGLRMDDLAEPRVGPEDLAHGDVPEWMRGEWPAVLAVRASRRAP